MDGEDRDPAEQILIHQCLKCVLTVIQDKLDRFDFV